MSRTSSAQAILPPSYPATHRAYELCGIFATLFTGTWLVARLVAQAPLPLWCYPVALVLGVLGADFVSGVVHWGFDTWGDLDTPLVGQLAIRTFREHHRDPSLLLHHDFVETNGHNFMLCLPLTVGGLLYIPASGASDGARFLGAFFVAMAVFVALTSQIHKWAHMHQPPRLVRALQRARLLLSPTHHQGHHDAPHLSHYCITSGWLDGPLHVTRAFERIERGVTRATGIAPHRADARADR